MTLVIFLISNNLQDFYPNLGNNKVIQCLFFGNLSLTNIASDFIHNLWKHYQARS